MLPVIFDWMRLEELFAIFDTGRVAIVSDDLGFHGLITRVDVLNHLRR